MRVGGHSGIERVTVYGFCLLILLASWPVPVTAHPLVAFAIRPLITRLIASRAAATVATQTAANDAVYLTVARATAKPLSEKIAQQAARASVSVRLSRAGKVTWAGLGVASGIMTVDEIMQGFDKNKISVVTDNQLMPDAEIKRYNPTVTNPVFVYSEMKTVTESGSHSVLPVDSSGWKSDEPDVPATARFYICRGLRLESERKCYFGDNEEQVAFDYLRENYLPRNNGRVKRFEIENKVGGGLYPFPDGSLGLTDRLNVIVAVTVAYKEQECVFKGAGECVYTDVEKEYVDTQNLLVRINDHWAYGSASRSVPTPVSSPRIIGDLDTIYDKLQTDAPPLNTALLTRLLNYFMMQAASSPDYQGVPFNSTNAFTEMEVVNALKELNLSPTQLDLLSPVADPVTQKIDFVMPQVSTLLQNVPSGRIGADNEHPGVAEPALDNPPEGKQILAPLLTLFPFIKNVTLPVRAVQCPVAEFDVFEKHVVMDSHCALLEKSRSLLAVIAGVVITAHYFKRLGRPACLV